jgi:hypothetical protein
LTDVRWLPDDESICGSAPPNEMGRIFDVGGLLLRNPNTPSERRNGVEDDAVVAVAVAVDDGESLVLLDDELELSDRFFFICVLRAQSISCTNSTTQVQNVVTMIAIDEKFDDDDDDDRCRVAAAVEE